MTFKELLNEAKRLGLCDQIVRFGPTRLESRYYMYTILVSPRQAKKVASFLGLSFMEVLWGIFLHELGHACDDEEFMGGSVLDEVVAWEYAQELLPLSPLGEESFNKMREYALKAYSL